MKSVERIIFGCVALSTMRTRTEAFRLLDEAVAAGIRHFDTARSYGRGFSEKLLGEFLRSHGPELRVTTKAGVGYSATAPIPTWLALPLNRVLAPLKRKPARVVSENTGNAARPRPSGQTIARTVLEQSLAESCRLLGRQRLDIFLLHEALPAQLTPEAWEFLEQATKAGVIGHLGVGTNRGTLEQWYAEDPRINVLQYEGSIADRLPLMEKFPRVTHIHHSLFREAGPGTHGDVLRCALERNPDGKVIFSTRSRKHLRENVGALE